jgi:hypothetical protein
MTHLQLFRQIAEELVVDSNRSYSHRVLGKITLPETLHLTTEAYNERHLVRDISQLIYFYYNLRDMRQVHLFLRREQEELTPIFLREDPCFGEQLRKANQGEGYFNPGWKIMHVEEGGIQVEKEGLHLYARSYELASPASPLRSGEYVALRFPKHKPYASPGYYTFVSNQGGIDSNAGPLVRFYFHLHAQAAPLAVKILTKGLCDSHVRYSAKILNHPDTYTRPDAMVLYVAREDVLSIYPYLKDLYHQLREGFLPSVPAFTKPLAAGISVAEESQDISDSSLSFGQQRATLIARGLTRAFQAGQEKAPERYACVLAAFEEQGLDPAHPYLSAGSPDNYPTFAE